MHCGSQENFGALAPAVTVNQLAWRVPSLPHSSTKLTKAPRRSLTFSHLPLRFSSPMAPPKKKRKRRSPSPKPGPGRAAIIFALTPVAKKLFACIGGWRPNAERSERKNVRKVLVTVLSCQALREPLCPSLHAREATVRNEESLKQLADAPPNHIRRLRVRLIGEVDREVLEELDNASEQIRALSHLDINLRCDDHLPLIPVQMRWILARITLDGLVSLKLPACVLEELGDKAAPQLRTLSLTGCVIPGDQETIKTTQDELMQLLLSRTNIRRLNLDERLVELLYPSLSDVKLWSPAAIAVRHASEPTIFSLQDGLVTHRVKQTAECSIEAIGFKYKEDFDRCWERGEVLAKVRKLFIRLFDDELTVLLGARLQLLGCLRHLDLTIRSSGSGKPVDLDCLENLNLESLTLQLDERLIRSNGTIICVPDRLTRLHLCLEKKESIQNSFHYDADSDKGIRVAGPLPRLESLRLAGSPRTLRRLIRDFNTFPALTSIRWSFKARAEEKDIIPRENCAFRAVFSGRNAQLQLHDHLIKLSDFLGNCFDKERKLNKLCHRMLKDRCRSFIEQINQNH